MPSPAALADRAAGALWERAARARHTRRPPRTRQDVVVGASPPWLAALLAPSVTVGTRHEANRRGVPYVEIDAAVEPFVQPLLTSPVAWSPPPGLPESWRALAEQAAAPRRATGELATVRDAHVAARAALRRDAAGVVDDAVAAVLGRGEPVTVEIVCVTNRPHQLANVVANVARQAEARVALTLVVNGGAFGRGDLDDALDSVSGEARLIELDRGVTLGECLDRGFAEARHRYVVKMDDDDRYGPQFIADLLDASRYSATAVVGKHSHFAYRAGDDTCALRFPGGSYRWARHLAGGTLLVDRSRLTPRPVGAHRVGEDRALLRQVHRRGWPTFSADPFNYTALRGAEHTWAISDDAYFAGSLPVGGGWSSEVSEC